MHHYRRRLLGSSLLAGIAMLAAPAWAQDSAQGATVEAAIVVANPSDLTAGWSYTALSRARAGTRLLIHDIGTPWALRGEECLKAR